MTLLGHIRNGAIVADKPFNLPEGTLVCIVVLEGETPSEPTARRQGGQYAGQIWMAPDFDK